MIVLCESCRAQFDVDDEVLRPAGRKLKCSKCQAVFFQPPPKPNTGNSTVSSTPVVPPAPPDSISFSGFFETASSSKTQVLKKIPAQEDDFLVDEYYQEEEGELPDPEEILSDDDGIDELQKLEEIGLDEAFDEQQGVEDSLDDGSHDPEEFTSELAMGGYSESFSEAVEALMAKEGLIDTYMRDESQKPSNHAVLVDPDEEETVVGPKTQMALAKPTKREMELAMLAKDQKEKVSEPPVKLEKTASFIKMETKLDTDKLPDMDDEPDVEDDSAPVASQPSRRVWWLSIILLLTLGLSLLSMTDWWTYKRYEWTSTFRFAQTHGEWRHYPYGMVLLVSGSVSNTGRTNMMVPGIQVVLLNQEGKEVGVSLAYPGRVLDDKTLNESSEAALRSMAELQGEDKRLKMNKIAPGNTQPFQVIFVKPDGDATRFRLQLVLMDGKETVGKITSLPSKGG
ncbi:MAG: zinc-ribbon domain-containing protein [Magnetococcus sp. YQC-5]